MAAALRYCREQKKAKRVVTFICDSGNKYLSKMYNDFWLRDQGLLGVSFAVHERDSAEGPARIQLLGVLHEIVLVGMRQIEHALPTSSS